MTRLHNRETLAVVLLGLALALLIGWLADLGRVTLMLVAGWLVASLPVAMKVQLAILPLYLRLGFNQRALDLAVDIRDSAPNRKGRDLASLDVAMVQAAMGRFKDALKSLDSIKAESFRDLVQALVLANRAWCRAHLGQKLERALEEAKKANALAPEEGLLPYFEGLALHKMGRNFEARTAIESSLKQDGDPALPCPGERALILGDTLQALGEEVAALRSWREASLHSKGKGPFARVIEERISSSKDMNKDTG